MTEGALRRLLSGLRRQPDGQAEAAPAAREPTQASFEQVVIRLQQLVEERSFVDVRFPGRSDTTYQSLILKVDPLQKYILIDELFPSHGAFFVTPGEEVEVTSLRRGIPVRFNSWVKAISLDEADGYPAYRLALPDSVEAKQRRMSFRISVEADAGLKLRIRGPDGGRLLCTVQDLSMGGVGFSCQGSIGDMLRSNNQLKGSILSLPGLPDITCDLEVRKFEFRKAPYRHTIVGSRFDGLGTTGQRQVEQCITTLQRQAKRGRREV
jgi:c-di-GMP-binding flagellar brake protein YcgR